MHADSLTAFVRFHAFANRRIIETAAELSDDELRGPRDGLPDRSELARFFTDRGHSPGELDLLDAYAL
jgi:hypothetical protein